MQNPSLGNAQRITQVRRETGKKIIISEGINNKSLGYQLFHIRFNLLLYRSGTVNSNTVNSKFHLVRSFFGIFARFLLFHV